MCNTKREHRNNKGKGTGGIGIQQKIYQDVDPQEPMEGYCKKVMDLQGIRNWDNYTQDCVDVLK